MSMRVGGVWVPNSLAPRRFFPSVITRATTSDKKTPSRSSTRPQPAGFRNDSFLVPTSGTVSTNGKGPLSHIVPALGVAGLLITGAMRLHPVTAGAALFIGVGIAVLNYGSEPAGTGFEAEVETGQPDWLNPHF
jgi:hypothetical protein